jgi:hypothetical protein
MMVLTTQHDRVVGIARAALAMELDMVDITLRPEPGQRLICGPGGKRCPVVGAAGEKLEWFHTSIFVVDNDE